jgi:lactobin A/cerein 7B family class IIb bacteriocin
MRELTVEEVKQVDGGILPIIAFGVALGGKLTATSLAGWAFGSAGLIIGTYEAAKYLSK